MATEEIITKIALMEAHAESILQIAGELKMALPSVSTDDNQTLPVISSVYVAKSLRKREGRMQKSSKKAS